jgi:hypothetical protein
MPKGFDVENKGRFSAGKMKYPKTSTKQKKAQPAECPNRDGGCGNSVVDSG